MGLNLTYSEGQTPLDEDEKEGLLIKSVSLKSELDEFEQLGIERANEWLLRQKLVTDEILSEDFVKLLHKKMFGSVWRWAGEFRRTNKNIGVDKFLIGAELRNLFNDCSYWITNNSFSEDEIAVRFSHRIVSVHPFANGNGRHSRLIADVLINKGFGKPYFTWGSSNLVKQGDARISYLEALREADKLDYGKLILFARS
jgi:Fic-DOC domain mobile mystery protein B